MRLPFVRSPFNDSSACTKCGCCINNACRYVYLDDTEEYLVWRCVRCTYEWSTDIKPAQPDEGRAARTEDLDGMLLPCSR